MGDRKCELSRVTKESNIKIFLNLDGNSHIEINTGIGFFDHMLNSLAFHAGFDLTVQCAGDLNVDCHHTVEDVGITLGKVLYTILERDGFDVVRFGNSFLPMDESLAFSTIDISKDRPFFVFDAIFENQYLGKMESCLVKEFFNAFAYNARLNLHIKLMYGSNDHHKCEAIFKSVAYTLKQAVRRKDKQRFGEDIPSTKGMVEYTEMI